MIVLSILPLFLYSEWFQEEPDELCISYRTRIQLETIHQRSLACTWTIEMLRMCLAPQAEDCASL